MGAMVNIKVCENNYGYGTDEVLEKVQGEFKDMAIETSACWGYCDDCAVGPYVFINDEIVQADTPEALYEEIEQIIMEKRNQ